jgi:hypothetical protein
MSNGTETEDQRLTTLKEAATGVAAPDANHINSDTAWYLVRGSKGFENIESQNDLAYVREHWPSVYGEALTAAAEKNKKAQKDQPDPPKAHKDQPTHKEPAHHK